MKKNPIDQLLTEKHETVRRAAVLLGISPQRLYSYMKGSVAKLPDDVAKQFEICYGVNAEALQASFASWIENYGRYTHIECTNAARQNIRILATQQNVDMPEMLNRIVTFYMEAKKTHAN